MFSSSRFPERRRAKAGGAWREVCAVRANKNARAVQRGAPRFVRKVCKGKAGSARRM